MLCFVEDTHVYKMCQFFCFCFDLNLKFHVCHSLNVVGLIAFCDIKNRNRKTRPLRIGALELPVVYLGFVARQLMDFHTSAVQEAPVSLSLPILVTSGAIHPTESMVQLSLLLCSITLSIQTLHLFPFLQQTLSVPILYPFFLSGKLCLCLLD